MSKKMDAVIKARIPIPLKKRLSAIAKKKSEEQGNPVTASDLARQALHKFATEAETKAA